MPRLRRRAAALLAVAAALVSTVVLSGTAPATAATVAVPNAYVNFGLGYFHVPWHDVPRQLLGPAYNPVCMVPLGTVNGSPVVQTNCPLTPTWLELSVQLANGSHVEQIALVSSLSTGTLLCLDTANGSTAVGSALVVGNCNISSPTQQWTFDTTGSQWRNAAGCVTGYADKDANGYYADRVFPCAAAPNQAVTPIYRTATITMPDHNMFWWGLIGPDIFNKIERIPESLTSPYIGMSQPVKVFPGSFTLLVHQSTCSYEDLPIDPAKSRGTYAPHVPTRELQVNLANTPTLDRLAYNDASTWLEWPGPGPWTC